MHAARRDQRGDDGHDQKGEQPENESDHGRSHAAEVQLRGGRTCRDMGQRHAGYRMRQHLVAPPKHDKQQSESDEKIDEGGCAPASMQKIL
jgi:hypothetical protein